MILKKIEIIKRIHLFIKKRKTGNARTFSEKVGISERTLYRYMNVLKGLGASIQYSKGNKTFYYDVPCRVDIRFQVQVLEKLNRENKSRKTKNDNKKGKSRRGV